MKMKMKYYIDKIRINEIVFIFNILMKLKLEL